MANIFRTASVWLKIAIGSFLLGLLLFVIGFATNAWIVYPHSQFDISNGLWRQYACTRSQCASHEYAREGDYHRAIQAMECIGLIFYVLALLTLFLYMCMDSMRRRDFIQAATAFCFAGILFACIGFAIFGSREDRNNQFGYMGEIGWSMGIAIAGTVCYGLGGIMLILQLVR